MVRNSADQTFTVSLLYFLVLYPLKKSSEYRKTEKEVDKKERKRYNSRR